MLGEAEIDKADIPTAPTSTLFSDQQNIFQFDVSVSNAELVQVCKRAHQFPEDQSYCFLAEVSPFPKVTMQRSALTQFSDDAVVSAIKVGLIGFEDVWVVQFFQKIYFILHFFQLLFRQARFFEYFGSLHSASLPTDGSVDHSVATLAQFFLD